MQPRLDHEFSAINRSSPKLLKKLWDSMMFCILTANLVRAVPWLILIAAMTTLSGCDTLHQKKHDAPVMVQAPRRVEKVQEGQDPDEEEYVQNRQVPKSTPNDESSKKTAKADASEQDEMPSKEFDGSNIKQVSAKSSKNPWDDWKDDTAIFNAQVAATVNGAPILNGDVLDRYAGYLISVREEMQKSAISPKPGQAMATPADYEKVRYHAIQQEIFNYIQRKLLVERLKSGMKAEQIKLMEDHIDEMFEGEIVKLKRDLKVSNKTELEIALNKKGTTLSNVRANFALDKLAQECIIIKSDKPNPIERPDLVNYYQTHPDKFTYPAQVKWQQIQVSLSPDVNKKMAKRKLEQAVAELNSGVPIEKVAKKYSDGPTAKQGGVWDWMEAGNLKDKALEKKLFEMPVNQLSEIWESEDSLCVVRVTDRKEAGRQPFQDVQTEVRAILQEEQGRNGPKRLLKQIFSKAVIETQYTLPTLDFDN